MIVSFVICLTFLIYARFRRLSVLNPLCIFFIMWTFITGMYCLVRGDILPPSLHTTIIYAIGLFSFGAGAVVSLNVYKKKHNVNVAELSYIYYDYNLLYWTLVGLCWWIMGMAALRSLPYLLAGTEINEIRYVMREEVLGDVNVPFIYFAEPMSYVILQYSIFKIYKGEHVAISLACILITTILTELCIGGRFFLYYVAFGFFFLFFVKKIKTRRIGIEGVKRMSKTMRFLIILVITFLTFAIIQVTGEERLFSSIYSYFCGCIKLLDVKINEFLATENYTFGFTSLNGFVRPVLVVLRAMGIIGDLPQIAQSSETYLLAVEEATTEVSRSGDIFNGFVSMFYTFYVDLGIVGVIIGSTVWGWFCEKIFLLMKNRGHDKDVILYLLVLMALSMSMTRFPFCTYQYALSFVYVYFIFEFGRKKQKCRTTTLLKETL